VPDPHTSQSPTLADVFDASGTDVGDVPSGPSETFGTYDRDVRGLLILGDGKARLLGTYFGDLDVAGATFPPAPSNASDVYLVDVSLDAMTSTFTGSAGRSYPGMGVELAGIALGANGASAVAGRATGQLDLGDATISTSGFVALLPP
jgi:hypothetical protein